MLAILLVAAAHALPGTHAPVVATWDTRASTVGASVAYAPLPHASMGWAKYDTTFSSTTARLSSQFGLYAMQLQVESWDEPLRGAGANATTMWNVPFTDRHDNGLPKMALAPYVAPAPNVLVSGQRNHISLPLVVGVGFSWAPTPWLLVTPNVEGSTSVDFDTRIDSYTVEGTDGEEDVNLGSEDVEDILADAVRWEVSVGSSWRAGLATTFTWRRAALALSGGVLQVSSNESATLGRSVGPFGAATFTWQWDRVVPAVLPGGECELPVGHDG